MIGVTDVVRCIKPFWDNMPLLCQDTPDTNELFIKINDVSPTTKDYRK